MSTGEAWFAFWLFAITLAWLALQVKGIRKTLDEVRRSLDSMNRIAIGALPSHVNEAILHAVDAYFICGAALEKRSQTLRDDRRRGTQAIDPFFDSYVVAKAAGDEAKAEKALHEFNKNIEDRFENSDAGRRFSKAKKSRDHLDEAIRLYGGQMFHAGRSENATLKHWRDREGGPRADLTPPFPLSQS